VLGIDGEYIIVRGIVPDSPAAAQKDIHVGDRIMAVAQDKEPAVQVQSGQLAQAVALIRGPKGTTVRLTIVPVGEDDSRVRAVSFVRGELKAPPRLGDTPLTTSAIGKRLANAEIMNVFQIPGLTAQDERSSFPN
jgi:carboxyl-terminal processing protease